MINLRALFIGIALAVFVYGSSLFVCATCRGGI